MDGLVEVKGIKPCVLLAGFIEKRVFIMSCFILNFSGYFSSHSGIPLTIFTIISLNISSSDLDLVVSGGRGLLFCVDILSAILSILSATWFIAFYVILNLHFSKYWAKYFSFSRIWHSFHLRSF